MNVVQGGNLYQAISAQIKTDLCHYQTYAYDVVCIR